MKNKPYYFQMEIKTVSEDGDFVRVKGFASTPDIDRHQDIVEPEAYKDALTIFMTNPQLLRSHDGDRPIGEIVSATVTEKGLFVEAVIKEKETADEVTAGLFRTFSVGFIPTEVGVKMLNDDGTLRDFNPEEDSYWDRKAIRIIKKLDLVEISIVATPSNPHALFSVAKALKQYSQETLTKAFNMNIEKKGKDVPKTIKHVVTQEDLDASPELVTRGVKVGETIDLPVVATKETGTEEKVEAAPEGDNKVTETAEVKTKEGTDESEKAGEKTADEAAETTDGGEGAGTDDEQKTDEEKAAEVEEAKKATAEERKTVEVTASVYGVLTHVNKEFAAKMAADGESIDSEEKFAVPQLVLDLLAKTILMAKTAADEVNVLKEKLEAIPDKKGLVQVGQFDEKGKVEVENSAPGEQKKASGNMTKALRMLGLPIPETNARE